MIRLLCAFALAFAISSYSFAQAPNPSLGRKLTTVQRLELSHLKAAQEDAQRLSKMREELKPVPGYNDYKAILHAHAEDSTHTGGTRPEMLADAKKADVKIIMLSDHFRPPRDYMDSWRGLRDGVLFIPGSESHGFLIYPEKSIMDKMTAEKPEFIKAVTEGEGLIFLSHVEERTDHSMEGLTGMEVYNRHYDAMDDNASMLAIAGMMTDPKGVATLETAVKFYPDEVLAAQLDYPRVYFTKWDKECQNQRVVGVAANDCHHNQVFIVKKVDDNTVLLGTIVDDDDEMRKISADQRPTIKELTKGRSPGDVLVSIDFDPYYRSFRNVATHILSPNLSEESVRDAVREGHAFISHDWMTDATGFQFMAMKGIKKTDGEASFEIKGIMGDELKFEPGLALFSIFPLECKIRLIRNGEAVKELQADVIQQPLTQPGVYRIEGWLTIDGEERPWVYSNPIYVR